MAEPLDLEQATAARGDISVARLAGLELAAGTVFGTDGSSVTTSADRTLGPRAALERVVAVALSNPPCVVSFSGGRDSSAVLALATHVARRDGHALPVPVTLRFDDDKSREDEWQRELVRHLRLPEWVCLHPGESLDVIGDVAMRVLDAFGVIWPFNAHFHLPIAEQAQGGSVLTGVGGDEILTMAPPWHRVNRVLARRVRPTVRDIARLGAACAPRRVRAAFVQRSMPTLERPWLTPEALCRIEEQRLEKRVAEPVRWGRATVASMRSRYVRAASEALTAVGVLGGARVVVNPFFAPAFLRAVGRHHPFGFDDRAAAMRELFGDLLPPAYFGRASKATFDAAFWGPVASAFAADWDGTGLDPELVDVEVLRRAWKEPSPPAQTFSLLQAARLAPKEPR